MFAGKRRGKKIKEEQEKEKLMKDNNKGKSREDNVRPTSGIIIDILLLMNLIPDYHVL